MNVTIFGRGKVGRALCARALERGAACTLQPARGGANVEGAAAVDLAIFAVPDAAIAETQARLDDAFPASVPFVHCAGTMPAEAPLPSGRPTGAMHPIVSFARPSETAVEGRTFSLRGHPAAVTLAARFTRALGSSPLVIAEAGPSYHAASAILANGGVALAHLAVEILTGLGIQADDAAAAMAGLLRSIADNVEAVGVPAALTGPIARGDVDVVRMHRESLDEETRRAYDAVSRLVLRAAVARGLDARSAQALEALLAER